MKTLLKHPADMIQNLVKFSTILKIFSVGVKCLHFVPKMARFAANHLRKVFIEHQKRSRKFAAGVCLSHVMASTFHFKQNYPYRV